MQDTAGESKTNSFSYGSLLIDMPALADQQELTNNSSASMQDLVWKTCQERWMIGMNGERDSGKSVLAAQLDDNDIYVHAYMYNDRCAYILL